MQFLEIMIMYMSQQICKIKPVGEELYLNKVYYCFLAMLVDLMPFNFFYRFI